ncbi:Rtt107p [Lachancea thermotolerans CBS 6340]|uniref:KLTH0C01584p n=1 Tax=Lachancea thermotolerans (strain ATCC 56472 / CBS 6340 / NRRL Y-8284) TaxID=559295 RepID=C5DDJ9_LACTC|nr:KLTH0C01584p [Lachancea thermotolerans CBS 6340]CAR21860.1 KLTH0C01584p [Lachancea thermotolerans CBS 6340]
MSASSKLFQGLNFVIVANKETEPETERIIEILENNSANKCTIYNVLENEAHQALDKDVFCKTFDFEVHAIIASTCDFWFYRLAAFDFLIPVVTSDWVNACVATRRITRASSFSPDSSHLLKNHQIYVSKHAFSPSEYTLYSAIVRALGGVCIDHLSSKTSHILTNDAQDPAIAAVADIKSLSIKYVLPTWAVAVFASGDLVSETPYSLDPHDRPEDVEDKSASTWELVQKTQVGSCTDFLCGHEFFFSSDLILPSQCFDFLVDFILAAGGNAIRHSEPMEISKFNGDCFLGQNSISEDFISANSRGLHKGNLSWLFHMWSLQSFVLPQFKLLLSPLRPPVFNKGQLILSYTNYLGQQRYYIQKLVEALGGVSTTELTKKNTHLLTCLPLGQKYEAALRWEGTCKIANHLWLEDCYRKQTQVPFVGTRYNEIPAPGGLSTKLGQMPLEINDEDLTDTILPQEADMPSQNHILLRGQDSATETPTQCEDVLPDNGIFPDPVTIPEEVPTPEEPHPQMQINIVEGTSSRQEPLEKHTEHKVSSKRAFDEFLKDDAFSPDQTLEPHKDNTPSSNIAAEGAPDIVGPQRDDLSQEATSYVPLRQASPNASFSSLPHDHSQFLPSSNSRKAKEKAALKLHTDMEALNEFEQNLKRKKNRSLLPEEIQKLNKLKEVGEKVREHLETVAGRPKGKSMKPYDIIAVCTGCHEEIDEFDLELLRRVGVTILKAVDVQCNTIIAPKKMRTAKFLTSFGFHPLKWALMPEFVSELLSIFRQTTPIQELPKPEDYLIPEIEPEVLKKTKLSTKVFQRAGIKSINLTEGVPGGEEVLSSILKAHGVLNVHMLPKKYTEEDVVINNGKKNSPTHILIAQKASQSKKFAKLCRNAGENKVMVVEWNWCVESIFTLEANLETSRYVVYRS